MNGQIDRKEFLKKAGVGTVAAGSISGLLASQASAQPPDHRTGRIFDFVAISQARPFGHVREPRMRMQGCGNFDPNLRSASGGGSYVIFDNAAPRPKPLIQAGRWLVDPLPAPFGFTDFGLPPYGDIQPSAITIHVNVDGIGGSLHLRLHCNAEPAGGKAGLLEGFFLDSDNGPWTPLDPPLGFVHLSVPGFSITA